MDSRCGLVLSISIRTIRGFRSASTGLSSLPTPIHENVGKSSPNEALLRFNFIVNWNISVG